MSTATATTTEHGTFQITTTETTNITTYTDREPFLRTRDPIEGGIFKGLLQPCLAELVGVSLFVFLSAAAITVQSNVFGNGIIQGLAIAVLVTTFGSISGGHFNPAVTLGVFLCGGIDLIKTILYILSQLVGGILGAAFVKGILTEKVYKGIVGGSTIFPSDTLVGQGILAELLITGILVLVVLISVGDSEWKSSLAPIVIGLTYLICIASCGKVTGASMNPAQSFGTAVVTSSIETSQWDYHYIYWVGPILGSLVAAVEYRILFASEGKRLFF